jgi:hypothetical protein
MHISWLTLKKEDPGEEVIEEDKLLAQIVLSMRKKLLSLGAKKNKLNIQHRIVYIVKNRKSKVKKFVFFSESGPSDEKGKF